MDHRTTVIVMLSLLAPAAPAAAWNAHGHRLITSLAFDALPGSAPAFLREPGAREMVAEEANEPDRWRGVTMAVLAHVNDPDHYIDAEKVEAYGLTMDTLPHLRNEYIRAMCAAGPGAFERSASLDAHPADAAKPPRDAAKTGVWPGFLPYAVSEEYAKLRSSFNTYRILESLGDPARARQAELARMNVIVHMGLLAHFVGDSAQPLHTTVHHHGWIGENPKGYTTDKGFHAYVDGKVLDLHGLTYDELKGSAPPAPPVDRDDPFPAAVLFIEATHELVEPLYQMRLDGRLEGEEGKRFISERLVAAGSMLGALYTAAWTASEPTEREINSWVNYNRFKPEGAAPPVGGSAAPPGG